jgi:hypothetical protein
MNVWNKQKNIPDLYGSIIGAGLIAFFFLMYAFGLIHTLELRLFNLLIMLVGIYSALKQYRKTHEGQLNYFRALTTGVTTAAIGTIIFSVFLFIYLSIDTNLMNTIREKEPLGMYLNVYIASAAVFTEGIFSGLTITYLITNYITTDQVNEPIDVRKANKQQG